MKKKIFTIILTLLLVSGCSLFDKKEEELPKKENPVEQKEPAFGDPVKVSDEESKMFEILINYGKKLYDEKAYEKLNKKEDGTYFISINDLKNNYNYDVSKIDSKCDFDESGVVIDLNGVVHTNLSDEEPPVVGMLKCK